MAPQREWFEKDYYKILGIVETADEREITRAYRRLAKKHHPDANPGSEERFKEISAAYDVLGDKAKRKEYDEVRRMGPMAGVFGGAPGGAGPQGFSFRVDDLSDLFGGLFGRGSRAGRGSGPRRGLDLEAELHLSFLDAVNGITTTVNVTSDTACRTCGGTGAAPGTVPVPCPRCGGRGFLDENQGMFSVSQPCPECGGRGVKIEQRCRACKGTGVERRARQVKVRIPPGVENGQRIRLKGRGGSGRNNGQPGDLYVTVHVSPHQLFGRQGPNLTLVVPVAFSEAVLGATIKVPTLDSPVSLRIPPGTRSGRTFRIKGRGVQRHSGSIGDLLMTVEVQVPKNVSRELKEAVEALASVSGVDSPRAHLGV